MGHTLQLTLGGLLRLKSSYRCRSKGRVVGAVLENQQYLARQLPQERPLQVLQSKHVNFLKQVAKKTDQKLGAQ